MSALGETLLEWWQEREPKERLGLEVLAGLAVVALVVGGCVAPALAGRQAILNALPGLREELAIMDAQAQEAQALVLKGASEPVSGEGLRDALTTSLHEHGFQSKPLAAVGAGMRIELHDVSFAGWAAWLDEVREQFHVKVTEAHVTALKPGQVDLTATLSPP